jgi:predicted metal-dependent hydrolase
MQVETAPSFETIEQIYERVFRVVKPGSAVPDIAVRFRQFANANSRIRLEAGNLTVEISDLLQSAPDSIQEALAHILLGKLYRKRTESSHLAHYRRYLNRSDVRSTLHLVKRQRGRKTATSPEGRYYNLTVLFEELNFEYFGGMMARPALGWSKRESKTTLGHYDPAHNVIVLSSLLDSAEAPPLVVKYVMFHEMLHLKHPTQQRGSRRCVHTNEFKESEKQFKDYEDALHQLRSFLEACYRQKR